MDLIGFGVGVAGGGNDSEASDYIIRLTVFFRIWTNANMRLRHDLSCDLLLDIKNAFKLQMKIFQWGSTVRSSII